MNPAGTSGGVSRYMLVSRGRYAKVSNVKVILKKWLTDNGYDGLYEGECGCRKSDLFPCGSDPGMCMPGKIEWFKDDFDNRQWKIVKGRKG